MSLQRRIEQAQKAGETQNPGDSPVGQQSLMPPLQRRAGFRISIGVIAEASGGGNGTPPEIGPSTSVVPATPTARAVKAVLQIEPPGSSRAAVDGAGREAGAPRESPQACSVIRRPGWAACGRHYPCPTLDPAQPAARAGNPQRPAHSIV